MLLLSLNNNNNNNNNNNSSQGRKGSGNASERQCPTASQPARARCHSPPLSASPSLPPPPAAAAAAAGLPRCSGSVSHGLQLQSLLKSLLQL